MMHDEIQIIKTKIRVIAIAMLQGCKSRRNQDLRERRGG